MLIFQREIEQNIIKKLFDGRVILLFGPRQSGKTTLVRSILKSYENDFEGAYLNCELSSVRDLLVPGKPELLYEAKGKDHKMLVLDEAQTIEHIGAILKNLIDTYPKLQIIATGSSSFDLANRAGEPLTGRSYEFMLYPLSYRELTKEKIGVSLDFMFRFGMYPAIASENEKNAEIRLRNLSINYLYKDIFTFEAIRKPKLIEDLLKLLAHQIGSQVSMNKLANSLGTNKATIERYIDLLEKTFIVKRIYSFARNARNELKKSFKVYFLDVGIRNMVINKLDVVENRADRGALFENFFIVERMKFNHNRNKFPNFSFWRTYSKQEVDWIEEADNIINAFECKWQKSPAPNLAKFISYYSTANCHLILPETLRNFL